ncbi:hypothetical protein GCM10020218_046460 [Dactylosporangium vinaceum]
MGVMFALGGSLMAASLQRSAVRAVTGRLSPALRVLAACRASDVVCFPLGDLLQVWQLGPATRLGYFAVALVLPAAPVLVLGPVEDIAARRPPAAHPPARTRRCPGLGGADDPAQHVLADRVRQPFRLDRLKATPPVHPACRPG